MLNIWNFLVSIIINGYYLFFEDKEFLEDIKERHVIILAAHNRNVCSLSIFNCCGGVCEWKSMKIIYYVLTNLLSNKCQNIVKFI